MKLKTNASFLRLQNVTMDLVVEQGASPGTQTQYVFLMNGDQTPCFTASNLERLKSGLEDCVLRHGNCLEMMCEQCFSDRYIICYAILVSKHLRLNLVLLEPMYLQSSNVKYDKSGYILYIFRKHLKVGSGTACPEENRKRPGGTMEVVIVISDLLETTRHCSRSCEGKTEVCLDIKTKYIEHILKWTVFICLILNGEFPPCCIL